MKNEQIKMGKKEKKLKIKHRYSENQKNQIFFWDVYFLLLKKHFVHQKTKLIFPNICQEISVVIYFRGGGGQEIGVLPVKKVKLIIHDLVDPVSMDRVCTDIVSVKCCAGQVCLSQSCLPAVDVGRPDWGSVPLGVREVLCGAGLPVPASSTVLAPESSCLLSCRRHSSCIHHVGNDGKIGNGGSRES